MALTTQEEILQHKRMIEAIGLFFVQELAKRLDEHDNSKLEEPEITYLTNSQREPTYLEKFATHQAINVSDMQAFFKHHYKENRHHPEHFENGIDGMTLLDVLEMFIDWCAATSRSQDGNIYKSIQFNRFNMSPQLKSVFMNTANEIEDLLKRLKEESQNPKLEQ